MMHWRRLREGQGGRDPRIAVTWLGAAVVLGCGLWLSRHGGPVALQTPLRLGTGGELRQEVGWIDRRLLAEEGPGAPEDAQRECRVASLHWDRATRLMQNEYSRRFGLTWTEGDEAFGTFRQRYLQSDRSGDVAATIGAARRALALLPPGPGRVRPLWLLSLGCMASDRWREAIGALVEVVRYKPQQQWVWHLLAAAYQSCGDGARAELAAEQAWRLGAGRPGSAYITAMIQRTPYARPAAHSDSHSAPGDAARHS